MLLLSAVGAYGQCSLTFPTSWVATGNMGLWNTADNWSNQEIPNGQTTNVCLTNGSPTSAVTTLENIFPSVFNLQVGANNTLDILTGRNLSVYGPSIINSGAILLTSAGQATQLLLNSASSVTLSGGGSVILSGSSAAAIFGSAMTLENLNNTIQGQGSIGSSSMTFQNDLKGLVAASVNGQSLLLNGGTVINAGSMAGTLGGVLTIGSGTIVNNNPNATLTGGFITTDGATGSLVLLSGSATIQGGTLNGNIQGGSFGSFAPTLDGFTHGALNNLGIITIPDDSGMLVTSGSVINNVGSIVLAGKGSLTGLSMGTSGLTQLIGGGVVTLTGGGATSLFGTGGMTLENVNNTIQGMGQVGGGQNMVLQNDLHGFVNGNVSIAGVGQPLILDGTGGVINLGTLEATNGGILQISNIVNNNPNATITGPGGGLITTDNVSGSVVHLASGADIQGGTLNGNVQSFGNPTLDGITHGMLTNAATGTITVADDTTITVAVGSVINNIGTIALASKGNQTYLYLGNYTGAGSPITQLTGGGTLTVSNTLAGNSFYTPSIYGDGGVTLENVNNTIQGLGVIGIGHDMVLQNDSAGVVNANVFQNGVGQALVLNGSGGVINTGTLEATGGGILQIQNTVNNMGGTISTDKSGSSVQLFTNSDIQGGTLNGNIRTVGNQSATLDGITHGVLTNAGTVTVVNGSTLILAVGSTIHNTGTIALASLGGGATLYLGNTSGTTMLTGGGTITLSDSANSGAPSINGNGVTLENVNNLIQGEGVLGGFQTTQIFQNDGLGIINANVAGHSLILDAPVTSKGLLEATAGGILQIQGAVNNSGGTISTDSGFGSVVQIANGLESTAIVQGGTLNGNIQTVAGNAGTLDGLTHGPLTNLGTVTVVDASTLNLALGGTISNEGLIALTNAGDGVQLNLGSGSGTTTLTGGGTVTLSNTAHAGNTLISGAGGATLENVNNTIQGEGQLGAGTNVIFKNDSKGIINANSPGQALTLNGTGGVINTGTLEATLGGKLQIETTINNFGGTISTDLLNGSVVQLFNRADIQGGILIGNVQTVVGNTSPILDGITKGPLTNLGIVTVVNNSQLNVAVGSTIINSGAISLQGTGNGTFLYLGNGTGTTTLTGGGTVILSNTAHNSETLIYGDGGVTLRNQETIQGEGQIGASHTMNLLNDTGGTLLANVSGQTLFVNGSGTFTNNGTMQVNAGSTLRVSSPSALSTSTFSGSTLLTGTYIVNSGKLEIDPLGNTTAGEIATIGAKASVTLNGANAVAQFVDLGGNAALKPLAQVSGSFTVEGGFNFASVGTLNNSGAVTIGTSSSITTGAHDYTQNGGITLVNGTLTGTNVTITSGTLAGAGTVNGNATIGSGAILLPGQNVSTPGTLTFDPLTVNGTLQEVLTSSGFGVTNVTGALGLNSGSSMLDILQSGAYTPAAGTELIIMTAGSPVTGTFSTLENQLFNNGTEKWMVLYNHGGDNVVLEAQASGQITATWTGASGNWTTNVGGVTNWSCVPPAVGGCVPNNGGSGAYGAVLNSAGNTMTLGAGDTPNQITVNAVNIQNGALVVTGSGTTLTSLSTLTNSDTLRVNTGAAVNAATVSNFSGGTLTGGTWIMNGGTLTSVGFNGPGITSIGAGTTVTLSGPGATSGFVDGGSNDALRNLAANNGTLNISGGRSFATSAPVFANSGTLTLVAGILSSTDYIDSNATTVENGGVLTATGTYTENGGTTTIQSGGQLTAGTYTQDSGTTDIQFGGTLTATTLNLNGGTLQVDGTLDPLSVNVGAGLEMTGLGSIIGDVDNSGTVFAGDSASLVGKLTVDGNYTQENGATLLEDILSASSFSELVVNGNLTDLPGALINVDELAFTPAFDELFTILTYTGPAAAENFSLTGAFASDFNLIYGTNAIELQFNQGGGGPPPPVPEPRFLLLDLALAVIALAWKSRRANKHRPANH